MTNKVYLRESLREPSLHPRSTWVVPSEGRHVYRKKPRVSITFATFALYLRKFLVVSPESAARHLNYIKQKSSFFFFPWITHYLFLAPSFQILRDSPALRHMPLRAPPTQESKNYIHQFSWTKGLSLEFPTAQRQLRDNSSSPCTNPLRQSPFLFLPISLTYFLHTS